MEGENEPSQEVTWSIEGSDIPAAIDPDGVLKVNEIAQTGNTFEVKAVSAADKEKSSSVKITIGKLNLSPTNATYKRMYVMQNDTLVPVTRDFLKNKSAEEVQELFQNDFVSVILSMTWDSETLNFGINSQDGTPIAPFTAKYSVDEQAKTIIVNYTKEITDLENIEATDSEVYHYDINNDDRTMTLKGDKEDLLGLCGMHCIPEISRWFAPRWETINGNWNL